MEQDLSGRTVRAKKTTKQSEGKLALPLRFPDLTETLNRLSSTL